MSLLLTGLANLGVGGLIGLCGVAGFLLPMFYTGALGLDVSAALALSFLAFLVSGALGAWQYKKAGNLDVGFSVKLGAGSLVGALGGVWLNSLIPQATVKVILYVVVFLSGVSILLRRDGEGGGGTASPLLSMPAFVLAFGAVTGCICSLSGAGGPVLVMPLLVSLGMGVRVAVGVALLDSVFIAAPATVGYLAACDLRVIAPMAVIAVLTHGAGVLAGSKLAPRVPARPLKVGVAVFSILLAAYMLFGLFRG